MKKIVVFSLSALLLSCCQKQDSHSCEGFQSWDYPIKPGTEEWKQLQSHEEMVNACQIPENLLFCLSTEELTELCLQYPLLIDVFAFENTNAGLDKLFRDFNGIRVLYQRKDVSTYLTKRYVDKILSLSFLDGTNSDLEKGLFIITISTLEVLLCRIEWQESEGLKEVLQVLVAGYEAKCNYSDYFRFTGFETNFFARAHIIAKICEQCFDISRLLLSSTTLLCNDKEFTNTINELSYQLIK